MTGYCTPGVDPEATTSGSAVSLTVRPVSAESREHTALIPQVMSATVFVSPPPHVAGPLGVGVPQSASVTRMLAFPGTHIGSLNVNWRTSPESSVFAKPGPLSVSTAEVEVGAIVSGTVENVAVVGVGFRALARSVTGVSVFEI